MTYKRRVGDGINRPSFLLLSTIYWAINRLPFFVVGEAKRIVVFFVGKLSHFLDKITIILYNICRVCLS